MACWLFIMEGTRALYLDVISYRGRSTIHEHNFPRVEGHKALKISGTQISTSRVMKEFLLFIVVIASILALLILRKE